MPPPPRRGRSRAFTPAELRGTLGTLLKNTLAQAGVVRDVLERGAREGRARLEDVRHDRKLHDALATLGERVLERFRQGELPELADDPDIADAIAAIEEFEEPAPPPRRGRGRGDERSVEPDVDWIEPVSRSRFDHAARGGGGRHGDGADREGASAARDTGTRGRPDDDRDDADDARGEAVSSRGWTPPRAAHPDQRVWRPTDATPATPGARRAEPRAATPPAARTEPRPAPPRARPIPEPPSPARRGGIIFDAPDDDASASDDDLAEYMHPDDVPGRGPGSPGDGNR